MKTLKSLFTAFLLLTLISPLTAQESSDYYFSKEVNGTFDEIVNKTKASLKAQEFGIITEIEMDNTLKEKLDNVDIQRYTILGACNPKFAYETLQVEENIGLFLPCKVLVKEIDNNKSEVVMVNPSELMKMLSNEELSAVADEVTKRFQTALDNL